MRIRAIYAADDAFRSMPPAKRKLMRDEHLRPLIDGFFEWVKTGSLDRAGAKPRDQSARLRLQSGTGAQARAR